MTNLNQKVKILKTLVFVTMQKHDFVKTIVQHIKKQNLNVHLLKRRSKASFPQVLYKHS